MTNQEALPGAPFNPLNEGLYTRYDDGDTINHAAFLRAHAAGDIIGTCRTDGGPLHPVAAYELNQVWWYEYECVTCRHTYLAPGGRILHRSSRHSEMTPGAWEARERRLRDQRKAA